MKDFLKELILHIRVGYILKLEALKLRLAIWLSNIKQKAHNRRYFVIPITVGHNKNGKPKIRLRSINNKEFNWMKSNGLLRRHMTTLELEQQCLYATPLSKNNKWTREQREAAKARYLRYYKVTYGLTPKKR